MQDWHDKHVFESWDDEERVNLGPCCACGIESSTVRNIVTLHLKGPIAGHGWGCLQCNLPTDGACCVLCDECLEKNAKPNYACAGYPGGEGRVPIESLTEPFDHDMAFHRDEDTHPYEEDDDDF